MMHGPINIRKNFMLSIYYHEFLHKIQVVKFWKFSIKCIVRGYRKKRRDHNFRAIPEFVWRDVENTRKRQ